MRVGCPPWSQGRSGLVCMGKGALGGAPSRSHGDKALGLVRA